MENLSEQSISNGRIVQEKLSRSLTFMQLMRPTFKWFIFCDLNSRLQNKSSGNKSKCWKIAKDIWMQQTPEEDRGMYLGENTVSI